MGASVSSTIKRHIGVLILLIILSKIIYSPSTVPIVYVAGDGSGNYNCDGVSDQVQINQALEYAAKSPGSTVYLKGPFTYTITSTILVGSYTTLAGDSNAKVKLVDNAGWANWVPLIGNKDSTGNHDITIQGFEIDGNSGNQKGIDLGTGHYSLIQFKEGSYNFTIQNMYLHHGCYDGARLLYKFSITPSNLGNVTFRDNIVYKVGHNGLTCLGMNNINIYDNDVFTRTNSAFSLMNSNHVKIYNNNIHSEYTGVSTGPGIEITRTTGNKVDDIEIYNNIIHTLNGAAIWAGYGGDSDNVIRGHGVHIHHNIIYDVGQYWTDTGYSNAGIVIGQWTDTLIENNVIDNGGQAGVQTGPSPSHNQTITTIVRNNTIINHNYREAVGIFNNDSVNSIIISQNNTFYNNVGGSYKGTNVVSSNDTFVDSLLTNATSLWQFNY